MALIRCGNGGTPAFNLTEVYRHQANTATKEEYTVLNDGNYLVCFACGGNLDNSNIAITASGFDEILFQSDVYGYNNSTAPAVGMTICGHVSANETIEITATGMSTTYNDRRHVGVIIYKVN